MSSLKLDKIELRTYNKNKCIYQGVTFVTTSKKQKFVGYKMLLDEETGDRYPVQINVVEERDFNFNKVWLQHLVNSIDGISNQRLRLAFWIIDNLDRENKLVMTQRAISEKSGMSLNTVVKTMKSLQESNNGAPTFLQKINSGAYRVNPDIIYKGSHSSRMGILYDYYETCRENKKSEDTAEKKSEITEIQEQNELQSHDEPTRQPKEPQSHEDYIRIAKSTNRKVGWAYYQAQNKGFDLLDKEKAQEIYDSI